MSFYKLSFLLKDQIVRENLFSKLWAEFKILGIHEGTCLSEEATELRIETESFTVDAALAPKERDWIEQIKPMITVYFSDFDEARNCHSFLSSQPLNQLFEVEQEIDQDWNSEWKKSFTGIFVEPFWRILPPWKKLETIERGDEMVLWINPGAGFGTGTHETTGLCLKTLAHCRDSLKGACVLDFGSGSGILSIAAAKLGAKEVLGVELDELAIENAKDNVKLNEVESQVQFVKEIGLSLKKFDVVCANILKSVLLEFRTLLLSLVSSSGHLILSGLVEEDLKEVLEAYTMGQNYLEVKILSHNEWRAVVFKRASTF